jgi:hypothetical protein
MLEPPEMEPVTIKLKAYIYVKQSEPHPQNRIIGIDYALDTMFAQSLSDSQLKTIIDDYVLGGDRFDSWRREVKRNLLEILQRW